MPKKAAARVSSKRVAQGGEKEKSKKRKANKEEEEEVEEVEEEEAEEVEPKSGASEKAGGKSLASIDFNLPPKTEGQLKIISWNVAGLRACLKKGFKDYLEKEQPDIMCLQETKADGSAVPDRFGYTWYFSTGEQNKGYSGTAILCKGKPIKVTYGMGISKHDTEGRLIVAEFENFHLINTYVPNSGRNLPRLPYRMEWEVDFLKFVKSLEETKPIIWCGDLNVAHQEIDLANPKKNLRTAGFTKEERDKFTNFLSNGFTDTYRHFNPNKTGAYTFWTFMGGARAKNVGWRLDYFVVSNKLLPDVSDSFMRTDVYGSDHCPLGLIVKK